MRAPSRKRWREAPESPGGAPSAAAPASLGGRQRIALDQSEVVGGIGPKCARLGDDLQRYRADLAEERLASATRSSQLNQAFYTPWPTYCFGHRLGHRSCAPVRARISDRMMAVARSCAAWAPEQGLGRSATPGRPRLHRRPGRAFRLDLGRHRSASEQVGRAKRPR